MIVKKLIDHCEKTTNARDKVYKIYSNNQVSLKIIHVMSSMHDQKKLQRVQAMTNKIHNRDVHLTLH